MTSLRKAVVWSLAVSVGLALLATTVITIRKRIRVSLKGAVVRQNTDPQKQVPIPGVQVTAIMGWAVGTSTSDASGSFTLTLPRGFRRRQPVTLQLRHPDYVPLDLQEFVSDKLYVVGMIPVASPATPESNGPEKTISNVHIRYSVKATTEPEVGSEVKTLQIVNVGNIPCKGRHPCSPDGKWKATLASTSLDAGEGNQFRNGRASCIAGPCPFARVEAEILSQEGRRMDVTARNWSDTVTFLLQAEVVHPMVSDMIRKSYPVIFGQALDFSLPATAEGPCVEAEVNGENIVFPLGPDLLLSWAHCNAGVNKDQTKIYRCQLKPGYRFR
jgi:hypothetical protein